MTQIVLLALGILIVFAVLAVFKAKLGDPGPKADVYFARKGLFSPAERSFLGVVEAQLPKGVRVFGKVRLEDILGVRKGLSRPERTAARNRINRKHVDFLLVRSDDLAPLAGIELDDASHDEEDRQERDRFVDAAFASAGLPLLHITAQKSYNPTQLSAKLADLLSPQKS